MFTAFLPASRYVVLFLPSLTLILFSLFTNVTNNDRLVFYGRCDNSVHSSVVNYLIWTLGTASRGSSHSSL